MEWNLQSNAKPMLDCTDEFYEKRPDTQKTFTQEFKEIKALLKEAFTEIFTICAGYLPLSEAEQLTAEQFISQFEYGEELEHLTGISPLNELQSSVEYYTIQEKLGDQQGKEEDTSENGDYNWILLDEKFIYGQEEVLFQEKEFYPVKHQEEDLIHKRETLFHLKKHLGYKVKWTLFDEQFIYGEQDELIQERKIQFQKQFIYGAEEIMKRDLLLERVALLWRLVWLRKKPRVRLKQ